MREIETHTRRATTFQEAAVPFHVLIPNDLPFKFFYFHTAPLCASAFMWMRFPFVFKRRSWLRTHSGRSPPPTI